jgi:2-dehydropantoate 2-reductase
MKIAVMGAGAVGCHYGGMLARAGNEVVLIGRPQHVEAVERQGLRLETQAFDEHIRVSASTEGSAVQGAQLVLFCVKSTDTESGAAAIKPHLAPDALVLSLQNGVENAEQLRTLLLQEVAAAVVYEILVALKHFAHVSRIVIHRDELGGRHHVLQVRQCPR